MTVFPCADPATLCLFVAQLFLLQTAPRGKFSGHWLHPAGDGNALRRTDICHPSNLSQFDHQSTIRLRLSRKNCKNFPTTPGPGYSMFRIWRRWRGVASQVLIAARRRRLDKWSGRQQRGRGIIPELELLPLGFDHDELRLRTEVIGDMVFTNFFPFDRFLFPAAKSQQSESTKTKERHGARFRHRRHRVRHHQRGHV